MSGLTVRNENYYLLHKEFQITNTRHSECPSVIVSQSVTHALNISDLVYRMMS